MILHIFICILKYSLMKSEVIRLRFRNISTIFRCVSSQGDDNVEGKTEGRFQQVILSDL